MKIEVEGRVFSKYPKLKIVFIKFTGIDNKTKKKEAGHLLQEAVKMVQLTFHKDNIKTHKLVHPWAVAQAEFGKRARHFHTSAEKLLRRCMDKKTVSANDTVTNLVYYLTLKNIVPFGVDDPVKISGRISYKIATGKENVGILKKMLPGALYYHDSKRVLGTKLDYWKSSATKLNDSSNSALVHLAGLPPVSVTKLKIIVKELNNLVATFCGGKVKVVILDKKHPSLTI